MAFKNSKFIRFILLSSVWRIKLFICNPIF